MMGTVFDSIENIVGKGENAYYQNNKRDIFFENCQNKNSHQSSY